MSYAGASLFIIGFTALLFSLGLVQVSKNAISISRKSASLLRNPEIPDIEKEKAIQANAMRLFAILGKILAISAVSIMVPLGTLYLLDLANLLSLEEVLIALQDLRFLALATVMGTAIYFVQRRFKH